MHPFTRLFLLLLFLTLQASPTPAQAPAINPGGVVNAADYTQSFSPGIMISLFGTDLAPATELAQGVPLPTVLAGVSVEILSGGATVEAPLFFVSAGQINAQLPYGLGGGQVQVRVKNGSGQSGAETVDVGIASPRLYTQTMDGLGDAILVHSDYSVVTSENPARAGEWVVLYLTGLGEVSPALAAGQAGGDGGSGGELNRVQGEVALTVNGSPASVYFAGLAPYFVGLYQINFQVPENAVPGMAAISVQLGGSSSQESVTFGCAVAYEQLAAASVGSGGGTVSGDGFSAEISAGALSSEAQITVYRVSGGTTVSNDAADPIFGLDGIPDDYSGPLTITMQIPGDPPVAGEGRLVLIEDGGVGGEVVTETEVNGSTVSATVQFGGGGGVKTASLRGTVRSAGGFDAGKEGVQVWQYVRELRRKTSRNGHFDVWYSEKAEASEAVAAAETLEWAEQDLLGKGYRWRETIQFPISAVLVRAGNVRYGSVSRSRRDNKMRMRIRVLPSGVPITGRRSAWGSVLIQLFHLQYDLESTFYGFGQATPWTWWHLAVFDHYRMWLWLGSTDFLFKNPLQLPGTNGSASVRTITDHARGAVTFIGYMNDEKGAGWAQSVLENWAPGNTPIDASAAGGIDIGEEWLKFCRKFSDGAFEAVVSDPVVPNLSNTAEVMTRRSLVNHYRLADESSLPKTITWGAGQDLMAEVYRFTVAHQWPVKSSLHVSLPAGGSDVVARVFEDDNPNGSRSPRFLGELTGGEVLEIPDFDQYQATSLVVMLINKRAIPPYNGVTPAQLRLEVKGNDDVLDLAWLRECKKIVVQLWGGRGTCTSPSGDTTSCNTNNVTIRSWLINTEMLLDIQWDGQTFSWEGGIDTPWSTPVRVEHSASGTMSEDGMSFLSGTFSDTTISENGYKIVRELEIGGPLPWEGFKRPRATDGAYMFKVDGLAEVPQYVVKVTYRAYNGDGSLYHEMTKFEYTSESTNLYVTFYKK